MALHYRIARLRRRASLQHGGTEQRPAAPEGSSRLSEAADLLKEIEEALDKNTRPLPRTSEANGYRHREQQ
jgi:hypothetical protein